jgi:hypothetical protein
MMIAEQQLVLIAAGDGESLTKLIPVIILVVFSIISAIAKKRTEKNQEEEEPKSAPPPRRRPDYRVPQPARQQPGRAPMPQRQLPRQVQRPAQPAQPQRTVLRQQPPVPQPAHDERHPKETFDRVNKPISTAAPASVGKLEQTLQDNLTRTERIQPAQVLKAEKLVETALKPSVLPPAEVAHVEAVEALDLAGLELDLHDPRKLREAILYREIFDVPLALR